MSSLADGLPSLLSDREVRTRSEWASSSGHARQQPDTIVGRLTLLLPHRGADARDEVLVRACWVTDEALGGRVTTTELIGVMDCRTGALRLTGVVARQNVEDHVSDRSPRTQPSDAEREVNPSASSSQAVSPDLDTLSDHFGLTPREVDVALLLADGEANASIAAALNISPHTARRHTESVMLKLQARTRAQVGAILRRDRNRRRSADTTHNPVRSRADTEYDDPRPIAKDR